MCDQIRANAPGAVGTGRCRARSRLAMGREALARCAPRSAAHSAGRAGAASHAVEASIRRGAPKLPTVARRRARGDRSVVRTTRHAAGLAALASNLSAGAAHRCPCLHTQFAAERGPSVATRRRPRRSTLVARRSAMVGGSGRLVGGTPMRRVARLTMRRVPRFEPARRAMSRPISVRPVVPLRPRPAL